MTRTPSLLSGLIDDVIRREGGYVNHPADKGGPTKYGITTATLSAWRDKFVSRDDVRSLTKAEAHSLYWEQYYLNPGIDKLPPSIQPFVFDAAVNHGPVQAIKFVQRACVSAGHDPGKIDGILGPRTIAAANSYANAFMRDLLYQRAQFYNNLVRRDPSQEVFLAGWMNRLDEFRA